VSSGEVVRRPPQKQRAISLRVSNKVEYCIVDSKTNKAYGYVTDGFGNVKQIPCPYPVTTPVFPHAPGAGDNARSLP
jgi:hypothetical protein